MCRLFGFRSIITSQIHSSLIHAENALGPQSLRHPDGWGVAYYLNNIPHIIKSTERALDDHIFHRVSGVVTSQTVLAHLRKATQGQINILNSHPFQFSNWVFAHNGNLRNFHEHASKLKDYILEDYKKYILGTTDSELIFFMLLSLFKENNISCLEKACPVNLKLIIEKWCERITNHVGPLYGGEDSQPQENHLTFILTNGSTMIAFEGGQSLHYSTHKGKCPERDTCPYFSPACEKEVGNNEDINHLLIASEKLQGENVWKKMQKGQLIGVNEKMKFFSQKLKIPFTTKLQS